MSIIIKDLDMPKETERVEIIFWHSIGEKDEYILQHNMDVKAIQIPTPHGRLIDADELQELYADAVGVDLSNYDVKVAVIRQNIKDMPAILESEE